MEGRMAKRGKLGPGHLFIIFVWGWGVAESREKFCFILLLLFFWPHHADCEILDPRPGIKPGPSVVKVRSPNLWATREGPRNFIFVWNKIPKVVACCSWLFRQVAAGGFLYFLNKESIFSSF